MIPRILAARHAGNFTVWLSFSDGREGKVDLAGELTGPVFEALRDPAVFAQLRLHPELRTLVWPNGADFAPEFLHSRLGIAA